MKVMRFKLVVLIRCLVSVLLAAASAAAQQSTSAVSRPTPRTSDGKPDLSGFWRGPLLRNMDKNVPGGFKAIFTPAGAAALVRRAIRLSSWESRSTV